MTILDLTKFDPDHNAEAARLLPLVLKRHPYIVEEKDFGFLIKQWVDKHQEIKEASFKNRVELARKAGYDTFMEFFKGLTEDEKKLYFS
jgi:hypothetical protein